MNLSFWFNRTICLYRWVGSVALALCLWMPLVQAETKGQIINVNQNFQIAFTDLGSSVLKPGDVVKVLFDQTDFIYMEVLESSSILSKLGPTQHPTLKTNLKDFIRISVGNSVVKISAGESQAVVQASAPEELNPVDPEEVKLLRNQLSAATQEILQLKTTNEALMRQIADLNAKAVAPPTACSSAVKVDEKNVNELLSQLKLRLEKMDKTLNE